MVSTDRRYGVDSGVALKAPCRVATTANITLSGLQTIDGATVIADDRVVVKNQDNAVENGIYMASASAWTRAADFDGSRDVVGGTVVRVLAGSTNIGWWEVDAAFGDVAVDTDEIEFVITEPPGALAAANITVADAGAYLDATNVETAIQEVIDKVPGKSPRFYGSAGNGSTNDYTTFQAAMSTLGTAKGVIDGGGKTFKINSALALSTVTQELVIRNMTLDMSACTDLNLLSFSGSLGSNILLTGNASRGDVILTLADTTGLAVRDTLWLSSTAYWATVATVTNREMVRIKSVDSATQVTLYGQIKHNYTTANTAKVNEISFFNRTILDRVRLIGNSAVSQKGIIATYCNRFEVTNFEGIDLNNRHVEALTCYDTLIGGIQAYSANTAGLAYAVAITDGCQGGLIQDVYAEDMRYAVAFGGTNGVCREFDVLNTRGYGLREGIINTHAGSEFIMFDGARDLSPSLSGVTKDGVTMNGINLTLKNIVTELNGRHGIYCGVDVDDNGSLGNYIKIQSSQTRNNGQVGVNVENSGTQTLSLVSIEGHDDHTPGSASNPCSYFMRATDGDIDNLIMQGNLSLGVATNGANSSCLSIIGNSATKGVKRTVLNGNIFKRADDLAANIVLTGHASLDLGNVSGHGNILENGTYGVSGTNVDEATINFPLDPHNQFIGMATGKTTGIGGYGELTWNPGSLGDGVGETSSALTITGAALGDSVAFSAPYDLQGITANAYVDSANSVKIRLQNETTGTIDLASGTWRAWITRRAA